MCSVLSKYSEHEQTYLVIGNVSALMVSDALWPVLLLVLF